VTRPIRLLIFGHSSALAGAERSLIELVAELTADHGVACTVVLPCEGPLRALLHEAGAATLIIEYWWWCRWETRPMAQCASAVLAAVEQHAALRDADVVLTITSAIPWGAVAASYLQKPHLWYVHETGSNVDFLLPVEHVRQIIDETSNAILAVSHASRVVFERVTDDQISIVPYCIAEPPQRARPGATLALRPGDRPARLIVTGTITPHKGQQDAIGALRELRSAGHDVELIIVGPGQPVEVQRLTDLATREGVASFTHIKGFREDVLDAVADADIALVCSRNTALDRVMIEAMLLGKPVIAARSGGAIELCQEGLHGLLYTPGDVVQLAAKISAALGDPAGTAARARRGYEYAKRTFTRDAYGGAVFRKVASLVGAANPTTPAWPASLVDALVQASTTSLPMQVGDDRA
jgi:glycosyltransferase involved in cell wall biosynthesis